MTHIICDCHIVTYAICLNVFVRSHYPTTEKIFWLEVFSRPLYMEELNLLFPTIPNLWIFIWEYSWTNRFENTWCIYWTNMNPCIFKSIVSTIFSYENSQVWYRWKEKIQHFQIQRSRKKTSSQNKKMALG